MGNQFRAACEQMCGSSWAMLEPACRPCWAMGLRLTACRAVDAKAKRSAQPGRLRVDWKTHDAVRQRSHVGNKADWSRVLRPGDYRILAGVIRCATTSQRSSTTGSMHSMCSRPCLFRAMPSPAHARQPTCRRRQPCRGERTVSHGEAKACSPVRIGPS